MNHTREWTPVTKNQPCPSCGKTDWCAWSKDGWLKCHRGGDVPAGMVRVHSDKEGALFRPQSDQLHSHQHAAPRGVLVSRRAQGSAPMNSSHNKNGNACCIDWAAEDLRLQQQLTPDSLSTLATDLDVTIESLKDLGVGRATRDDLIRFGAGGSGWKDNFPDGAFTFLERDGAGKAVGFSLRTVDGRKGSPSSSRGARRGLIIPRNLAALPEPVYLVEGATDVAAMLSLGLAAVGRPSNTGGVIHIARLLKGKKIIVVGEQDQKQDGSWPGRDGAERTASNLSGEWRRDVVWALCPPPAKDVRAWLQQRRADGPNPLLPEHREAAAKALTEALAASEVSEPPGRPPKMSERLVRLALELYRLGTSDDGESFAIPYDGPQIALMFRGSRDALRPSLAKQFRNRHQTTPGSNALNDALAVLQGEAMDSAPEPVHLRHARHEGNIVIDLGQPDGSVVVVSPNGWSIESVSPVLFRRTALTGALPTPTTGGSLDELRSLLNVAEDDWTLLVGFLVASLIPDIPRPILLLGGEMGTGKTTFAKFLKSAVDPSLAPLQTQPRDPEQWAVVCGATSMIVVDNISSIPPWWSDSLCKCVTGDGYLRRKLYTDSEIAVTSFRRVIILTSIDHGSLRGDLGDRLVRVDLEFIDPKARRAEAELLAAFREHHAAILGALLDVIVAVLRELPTVEVDSLPRMADFARVLAAMDMALGTDAFTQFMAQAGKIHRDVVEDDAVATAVMSFMNARTTFSGTAKDLLAAITPTPPPKDWPKNARALGGHLRRVMPALRALGVNITAPAKNDKTRTWTIESKSQGDSTAQTARPPTLGLSEAATPSPPRAVEPHDDPDRPIDRPTSEPPSKAAEADSGRSGGSGGPLQDIFTTAASSPSTPTTGTRMWI